MPAARSKGTNGKQLPIGGGGQVCMMQQGRTELMKRGALLQPHEHSAEPPRSPHKSASSHRVCLCANAQENPGPYACAVCLKELKTPGLNGLMRPRKIAGLVGQQCTMGAELPPLSTQQGGRPRDMRPRGHRASWAAALHDHVYSIVSTKPRVLSVYYIRMIRDGVFLRIGLF